MPERDESTEAEVLAKRNASLAEALDEAQREIERLRARAGEAEGDAGVDARRAEAEAEGALRESEDRFRTLADNIAQLTWMADGAGWIFWYNKRWFDYTGTTLQDMAGWGWKSVHHPGHVDRVVEEFKRCLASGEAWEDVFPLRGCDGVYRWFLSRALPIRDGDGKIVRWFGTNTDVTEQREAEERLRDADRNKDEFIAMLGHELRNPLAAIRNATEVLKTCDTGLPEVAQVIGVLERQSTHMARLVDGLLEVSRIAQGKIDIERKTLDLCEVVGFVVQDRIVNATAQGLQLHCDTPEAPLWVVGDPVRLTQVFENLVGNAIKFSVSPGTVEVSLYASGESTVVKVRDSGQGIRPEMLPRIFQPFVQEVQDAARAAGGLGLGLALAHGLVGLHGGTIEAHSQGLGHGSEFTVSLPSAPTPARPVSPMPNPVAPPRRVLIVEDNLDAAAMLRFLLQRRGHQASVVHRASEGLEALQGDAYDIVLCDLGLPDMSGHDFARAVRSRGTHAELRLVALTGYGQASDRERSLQAGFDAHLTKPVDLKALDAVLA